MSSSSSSCSHWWHAPIYIAAATALIFAAISSSSSSSFANQNHQESTSQSHQEGGGGDLLLALHLSGFHLTAHLLLETFPSLQLSSPFTLFALPDPFLSSSSDANAQLLLQRHVVPLHRLPLSSLLPRGGGAASFPTLLPHVNLTIPNNRIDGVISHPDLFVRGPHVVHGLSHPFPVSSPALDWERAARALESKGYMAFSHALTAVLDPLISGGLKNWTVFAARKWGRESTTKDEIRRHVAVGRYRYEDLAGMVVGDAMKTASVDENCGAIRITDHGGGDRASGDGAVEVNGVEVVEPGVYADDGIVVHGIARAFIPCWSRDGDGASFLG